MSFELRAEILPLPLTLCSNDHRNNKSQPKLEQIYELPQATVNLTKASLLLLTQIVSSWQQKSPRSALLSDTTLMEDNFVEGKCILFILRYE